MLSNYFYLKKPNPLWQKFWLFKGDWMHESPSEAKHRRNKNTWEVNQGKCQGQISYDIFYARFICFGDVFMLFWETKTSLGYCYIGKLIQCLKPQNDKRFNKNNKLFVRCTCVSPMSYSYMNINKYLYSTCALYKELKLGHLILACEKFRVFCCQYMLLFER